MTSSVFAKVAAEICFSSRKICTEAFGYVKCFVKGFSLQNPRKHLVSSRSMECVVLEFSEPVSALEQLGKVTYSDLNLMLCIGNLSFAKPSP